MRLKDSESIFQSIIITKKNEFMELIKRFDFKAACKMLTRKLERPELVSYVDDLN